MAFVQINIDEQIEQKCSESLSFKKAWEENRENGPSLKTFCNPLNAIGYELKIVKRSE